jgi:polar amino acid transport system substrate-binding protein
VAAMILPPSVMEQNGSLTGFNVDPWNAIAARLKLKTSYQIVPDVAALEEAIRSKKADLTLGVFITSARDEVFDFSILTLQAGQQIMVHDTGEKAWTASPLWDMLRLIFLRTTALRLGVALLLVLIPAHLVWLFERRHQDGMISSRNYFPDIFEAILWALSTLTSQGLNMPPQWVGAHSQSSGCLPGWFSLRSIPPS